VLNLFPPGFPLAPKGDPEGEEDELQIKPEALVFDVEEIVAEFFMAWGIGREVNLGKAS